MKLSSSLDTEQHAHVYTYMCIHMHGVNTNTHKDACTHLLKRKEGEWMAQRGRGGWQKLAGIQFYSSLQSSLDGPWAALSSNQTKFVPTSQRTE